MTVDPLGKLNLRQLTVRGLAWRSTRFWGYVKHDPEDHSQTYQKPQELCPASRSHLPLRVATKHLPCALLVQTQVAAQPPQSLGPATGGAPLRPPFLRE